MPAHLASLSLEANRLTSPIWTISLADVTVSTPVKVASLSPVCSTRGFNSSSTEAICSSMNLKCFTRFLIRLELTRLRARKAKNPYQPVFNIFKVFLIETVLLELARRYLASFSTPTPLSEEAIGNLSQKAKAALENVCLNMFW